MSKNIAFILSAVLAVASLHTSAAWAKSPVANSPTNVSEVCGVMTPNTKAQRAAQIACAEYQLWREPFINGAGQLVQIGPMEGENDTLTNGEAAWTRVLKYWTDGVGVDYLYHANDIAPETSQKLTNAYIRSRIIDNPWSAAFMSYVMKTAGMNDSEFTLNDGHIRYIKPAYAAKLAQTAQTPNDYAYTTQNPLTTRMAVGDLICYVREGADVYGVKGFEAWLSEHYMDDVSLKTHCDIVVGVFQNKAYSVGGNVAQAVTMRQLALTREGYLSPQLVLPATTINPSWLVKTIGKAPESEAQEALSCEPLVGLGRNCNMNRKDWVVLLKAKSAKPTKPAQ